LLIEKIKNLPNKPGVYQYFDENGKLLYIGKAKDLKKRVKSYFRFNPFRPSENLSPRIYKMITEVKDLNYIVVESENDALILENSLIKQLKPKYNILLRDDKTYPYIYIDYNEDFPMPQITRKVIKGKNIKYFGPFSSGANALLKTLEEPPPRTTFILQGAHVGQVLPTVRSRCQHLHAPRPSQAAALAWLQEQLPDYGADQLQRALMLQFGAPLAVVAWLNQGGWQRYEHWRQQMNALAQGRQDLVQVATDWAGWMDVTEPLRLLLAWSAQQLRQSPQLRWHRLQQVIVEALAALAGSANKQLMLEQVLVEFVYGKQD